jgi:hypothetical protein
MSGVEAGTSGANRGSYSGMRGDPAMFIQPITPATGTTAALLPFGPCRAIQSISSGTMSFMDHAGTTLDGFPIKAFDNPIGAKAVYSISGTTAIWGLY